MFILLSQSCQSTAQWANSPLCSVVFKDSTRKILPLLMIGSQLFPSSPLPPTSQETIIQNNSHSENADKKQAKKPSFTHPSINPFTAVHKLSQVCGRLCIPTTTGIPFQTSSSLSDELSAVGILPMCGYIHPPTDASLSLRFQGAE